MAGTLLFNALKEAIDEEMANDINVCVMGEDVGQYGGSYKVTKDLYEKYGELRVLDTPMKMLTCQPNTFKPKHCKCNTTQ